MYSSKSFAAFPKLVDGFLEDMLQKGKIVNNELWNEDKMHVPVNIKETEDGYALEIFAPGIRKEAFKIAIEKNVLTIAHESKTDTEEKAEKMNP